MQSNDFRPATTFYLFMFALAAFLWIGCQKTAPMDPATMQQIISQRNLGLAYLEDEKYQEAAAAFQTLVELAPQEPLGYANLGLTYLRQGDLPAAEKWLKEAVDLVPDHPEVRRLLARLYEMSGRNELAVQTLEKTLQSHPEHVRTLYQLAQFYQRSEDPATLKKAEAALMEVVNALPGNVAARIQLVEVLLHNGQPGEALSQMETIRQVLPELPGGAAEVLENSLERMREGDAAGAFPPARMFHNLLKPQPIYQAALRELHGEVGPVAVAPLYRFVRLDMTVPVAAGGDGLPAGLTFTDVTAGSGLEIAAAAQESSGDDFDATVLAVGDFDSDGDPDLFVSRRTAPQGRSRQHLFVNEGGRFIDRAGAAGIAHAGRDLSAVFADYDNDGYLDLFVTNTESDRLYRNNGDGTFRDASTTAGVGAATRGRKVLFADLDLEGDLDIFIATPGGNRLYRNNGDGTFAEVADETGVGGGATSGGDAVFGDFDDDGDIDLFVPNRQGPNRYFDNLRQGYFRELAAQVGLLTPGGAAAVAAGDYDNDGYLDLLVTGSGSGMPTLFRNHQDGTFARDTRSDSALRALAGTAAPAAAFFDADNDGYLDLLIAGEERGLRLFSNNGAGKFSDASRLLPAAAGAAQQLAVCDVDNDGDLDIFSAGPDGVRLLRNDGGNVNNYHVVRLTGLRTGSSKNNFYGIGAKVELKAGDLYQMRVMSEPVAHFGIGNRERADVVRVLWSNGVAQNHFRPERYQTIAETQIVKGSCPWLFAWDGAEYRFVTDVLWASAIGMPLGIMAGERLYAFPHSAQEYFKIPGEKLQPRNGKYALQFTTELWETPYLDRVGLLVVDHPDSVDIYVDEKFTLPPFPPFRLYGVAEKRLPVSVCDEKGRDLLAKIARADGAYVDTFAPGRFQGIAELHDLVLDLGDLSGADSVFLFLNGWLFPTDASINVHIAQSGTYRTIFPYLQVINAAGQWETVKTDVGFPKGKYKTVVVNLTGAFLTGDYRVRIRTNMQIYWDHVFYTTRLHHQPLQTVWLEPVGADLHYRGFSELFRETPGGPHIPDYSRVTTGQKWRDLTGFCTRYGDVLPLLLAADSKYVIMNAGDELSLEFDAAALPEALPRHWRRDFIFYNDGWLKDGDLNTAHGQTVEPLPFHGMTRYPYSADEAYPDDAAHRAYRREYNTRRITTEAFRRALFR